MFSKDLCMKTQRVSSVVIVDVSSPYLQGVMTQWDLNSEHLFKWNIQENSFTCWLFRCPLTVGYSGHGANAELKVCNSSFQS